MRPFPSVEPSWHRPRYRVGEAFMHIPLETAQQRLATEKEAIDVEVARIQDSVDECQASMKELKLQLYAKFGSSINLDWQKTRVNVMHICVWGGETPLKIASVSSCASFQASVCSLGQLPMDRSGSHRYIGPLQLTLLEYYEFHAIYIHIVKVPALNFPLCYAIRTLPSSTLS